MIPSLFPAYFSSVIAFKKRQRQKEIEIICVFSYPNTNSIRRGPIRMTSFKFIYLLLTYMVTLGVRGQHKTDVLRDTMQSVAARESSNKYVIRGIIV